MNVNDILGPNGLVSKQHPNYEARPGQIALSEGMYNAIMDKENLCSEAGTGTGKSYALVVAAILAGVRITISTATKSLQDQLTAVDIPFLQKLFSEVGINFTSTTIKGRSNYVCKLHTHEMEEQEAAGKLNFKNSASIGEWNKIKHWADTTIDGDLEQAPMLIGPELREAITISGDACLKKKCAFYKECHIELMKENAKRSDVIIVNHALLLADANLRFQWDRSLIPETPVVILDEAHDISDYAYSAFGRTVSNARMAKITNSVIKLADSGNKAGEVDHNRALIVKNTANDLETRLSEYISTYREHMLKLKVESTEISPDPIVGGVLAEDIKSWASTLRAVPTWLTGHDAARWEKLYEQASTLGQDFAAIIDPQKPEISVRYSELVGRGYAKRVELNIKPIEIAPILRDRLFNRTITRGDGEDAIVEPVTVLSTSATLAVDSSMEFWKKQVGAESSRELIVESPFDYQKQSLLYIPSNTKGFDPTQHNNGSSTPYLNLMVDEMERLIIAAGYRAFCLFTSSKALERTYALLAPRLECTVLKQGEMPRNVMLDTFRNEDSVLFGLKSYMQGIDERLNLVVIDKLPFLSPGDVVYDAKCKLINDRMNDQWAWFHQLAVPSMIVVLKQAAGRLIRNQGSRGVCAILDTRLSNKSYGSKVIKSLPPMRRTNSFKEVERFYANK